MTAPRPAAAVALLLAAALAAGAAACRPVAAGPAAAGACRVVFSAPPSASIVLIDPDSALARTELKTMLFTARPSEHFIILNADTGAEVGSYTTPPGLTARGPAPPAPLPADPTQVQLYSHRRAVDSYDRQLRREATRLQGRWFPALSAWAGHVFAQAGAEHDTGLGRDAEVRGFTAALAAAMATLTSLENIPGLHFGSRIVLAVLGLDGVPARPAPRLPVSLRGVSVAMTGFDVSSATESAWRQDFLRTGATEAVMLTSATSNELPVVVEPVLDGASRAPAGGCTASPAGSAA